MAKGQRTILKHGSIGEISKWRRPANGFASGAGTPRSLRISSVARSAIDGFAPTAPIAPSGAASARTSARADSFTETTMTTRTLDSATANDITTTRGAMTHRPRRLRRSEAIRSMVRETIVRPEDLIYPLFVVPNSRPRVEISSMPGVFQLRVREAVEEAKRAADLGVRAILLFGLPAF